MEKEVKLIYEYTPNPNSVRFISNLDIKSGTGASFDKNYLNSENKIDMVSSVLSIEGVEDIFLFDNFLTVTKNKSTNWSDIIPLVVENMTSILPFHDPDFVVGNMKKRVFTENAEEIEKIEKILDKKIRPALQGDGGDLDIVGFKNNVLKIEYSGACSSCPSATMGTLEGIEQILKDEYDEKITIEATNKQQDNIFY